MNYELKTMNHELLTLVLSAVEGMNLVQSKLNDYAKQTQFPKHPNKRKFCYNNDL